MHHGELDRAHLQHLGAERRHLQHLLEGDLVQPPRLRHDARIGRIDAVDVGVDVAAVRADRRGDGDRAGVGAAAAERRDRGCPARRPGSRRSPPPGLASEPLDQRRRPLMSVMRAAPCAASVRIGICQPCQERALTPISCSAMARSPAVTCSPDGDDRVVFARVVQDRGVAAERDELVGLPRHGGDDDRDLVAGVDLALARGGRRCGCARDRRPTCRRTS